MQNKPYNPRNLDEFLDNIKKYGSLYGLKYAKYETRTKEEKDKIKEVIVFTLHKFRTTPVEMANRVPDELYKKIDVRWKYVMASKKQMRERSLAIIVHELSTRGIDEALKEYSKRFLVKRRALRIMVGKLEEVKKEIDDIWRKIFFPNLPT